MTNQLLLVQVLAEGFSWDYLWHWTHDPDIWKAIIPASATVIASLIAIIGVWLTARRTTQQIELSKQGTPPELTRYITWVEASEKYKNLMEFERDNSFEGSEKEYKEIKASRKAALQRAIWERKVISACPDIHVQKRILNIPYVILLGKKIDFFTLWPWLKSRSVKTLERIFSVFIAIWLAVILIEYFQGVKNKQDFFVNVFSFVVTAYIFGYVLTLLSVEHGEMDAEYHCIQIRITETSSKGEELAGSFSRYVANRRRVRFAFSKSEYREWIYYPGFSLQGRPIWRFVIPVALFIYNLFPIYWVLCLFSWGKYGEWKMYGAYRPGAIGLDEEEKSKRELWTKLSESLKGRVRRFIKREK